MRWQDRRRSSNIEDRRGIRGPRSMAAPGGVLGVIAIVAVSYFMGIDPRVVLGILGGVEQDSGGTTQPVDPAQQAQAEFVGVVLADTEDAWNALFAEQGAQYREPTLVMFSGSVQSACGFAQAAMGPFYCAGDQKVYIDLDFYDDLQARLGAPGDFAQAYVIAHEVGHHVQALTGISEQVQQARARAGEAAGNALSVRQELQADCYAGIWANRTERASQVLEQGDVEEALNAASAIGDDRLQKQAQGYVVPESFTHGSSEQRVRWFRTGFASGDIADCDTFEAARL